VERGKTTIPDISTLLDRIDGDHRITLFPLDRIVLNKTLELQEIPEMHDRQIAATALVLADEGHTVHLLTKDSILVTSDFVSTIW
ncbi:MAG: twitching motility protein PilT, partial [Candidatus Latescibacterota bacterium]